MLLCKLLTTASFKTSLTHHEQSNCQNTYHKQTIHSYRTTMKQCP